MRFVIDALGISKPGGGRTSVLMQLSSVFALDKDNLYTVVLDSKEEAFEQFKNVEQMIVRIPNRLVAHLVAQLTIPLVALRKKASLVHHTKHLGAVFNVCPYVITINDMTTLRLPWAQSWVDLAYWRTIQHAIIRRASLVLAPSKDASNDIVYYYGLAHDKVRHIPYAPSTRFRPASDEGVDGAIRAQYGVNGNYILFVGIQALKKNIPTLIRAFRLLKSEGKYEGNLVIVGREYPQSSEKGLRGLAAELGLQQDVVFTGPVSDDFLPAFYRGADIFAFPSLHEGFGIVVLEAMACGVPVVASNASSLPEVVADAGLLVEDLRNERSWADTLQQVLFDDSLRSGLVKKGLRRASEFSWEKVGRDTLASYLSVAGQTGNSR